MKDVLLKLSDEDYRKLEWISEKLGIGISKTLRSLIPSIKPPDQRIVSEDELITAAPYDLVPIQDSLDRKKLDKLLNDIHNKKAAVTLAREINQQLIENQANYLKVDTYKRLSRWCHPHRWTKREKQIRPLALQISNMIFGHIIPRVKT